MRDEWTDELPSQEPSDRFIRGLREELRHAWSSGEDELPTQPLPPGPDAPSRALRPLVVGMVAAAAVLVAVVVVTRPDDGMPAAPEPAATAGATEPTSSKNSAEPEDPMSATDPTSVPTSTIDEATLGTPAEAVSVNDAAGLVKILSDFGRWVRIPTVEQWPVAREPWLRFAADGVVTAFDGCDEWTERLTLGDGGALGFERTPPASFCSTAQRELLNGATAMITAEPGRPETRLVLTPALGLPDTTYVAIDHLPTAVEADLVGSWQAASGERLTLGRNGTAALGPCDPAGSWSLVDGTLTVGGFTDPQLTSACSGGTLSGSVRGLASLAEGASLTAQASLVGDDLLLTMDDGYLWLRAAADREPALDLPRGKLFGFAPFIDLDSGVLVAELSNELGEPTQDTGWYTTVEYTNEDGIEDCLGNMPMRVVVWQDIAVAFLRLGGQDRMWLTVIGDSRLAATAARFQGEIDPPAERSNVRTADGLGVGSSLDELAAAGIVVTEFADDEFRPVTDTALATRALVRGPGMPTLHLENGTIMAISVESQGFC